MLTVLHDGAKFDLGAVKDVSFTEDMKLNFAVEKKSTGRNIVSFTQVETLLILAAVVNYSNNMSDTEDLNNEAFQEEDFNNG